MSSLPSKTQNQNKDQRRTTVFEFGPTVKAGDVVLNGVCTGDNPDVLQACTWSLEQIDPKSKDRKPQYRVEF